MIEAHPTRIGVVAAVGTRPLSVPGGAPYALARNGFSVTKSSREAQDVRKVLGISRAFAIGLLSRYSLGIMRTLRRFEESAIA
jgi:hypothetical protein